MTRVVVAPFRVATQPRAAGHFWAYVQYVDALRRLGCDVWWLEELSAKADPADDDARIATLEDRLRPYGMSDRIILYRWPSGQAAERSVEPAYVNVPAARAELTFRDSDLLLNFHYVLPASMLARFRRTALVDIDPGLLQLWWSNGQLAVSRHDVYFSIGENLGEVPHHGGEWLHTAPAVSLDLWPFRRDRTSSRWTSISSWHSSTYVLMEGRLFDTNKSLAYLDHIDLPRRTGRTLELATVMSPREEPHRRLLSEHGWVVRESHVVAGDPDSYRAYIQGSRGELGLAKPAYVLLGNGWLSDRTACYLASGRPAVVQHTGHCSTVPDGPGLLRFSSTDEAVSAIEEVEGNYEKHSSAAREIAEASFSATRVVSRMLQLSLRP